MKIPELLICILLFMIVLSSVMICYGSYIKKSASSVELAKKSIDVLSIDYKVRTAIWDEVIPYLDFSEKYIFELREKLANLLLENKAILVDFTEITDNTGKTTGISVIWEYNSKKYETADSFSGCSLLIKE